MQNFLPLFYWKDNTCFSKEMRQNLFHVEFCALWLLGQDFVEEPRLEKREALLWFSVLWLWSFSAACQVTPKKDGLQTERKRQSMRTLSIVSLALAIGLSAASPKPNSEVSSRDNGDPWTISKDLLKLHNYWTYWFLKLLL